MTGRHARPQDFAAMTTADKLELAAQMALCNVYANTTDQNLRLDVLADAIDALIKPAKEADAQWNHVAELLHRYADVVATIHLRDLELALDVFEEDTA